MIKRKIGIAILGWMFLTVAAPLASAIPILQLYAEGATYDAASESWVITDWSFSSGPIKIWAIGNVNGPGGKGTISDVRISIVYPSSVNPILSLVPSTATASFGFSDTSLPAEPEWLQTRSDGSLPVLSDGRSLPIHGQYGTGFTWQEFALGDFSLTDSPTADFINGFPTTQFPNTGQINVYELSVTGGVLPSDVFTLHVDLYDSVVAGNSFKAVFAPFSHDFEVTIVPEPSALVMLGTGLLLVAAALAARKRK